MWSCRIYFLCYITWFPKPYDGLLASRLSILWSEVVRLKVEGGGGVATGEADKRELDGRYSFVGVPVGGVDIAETMLSTWRLGGGISETTKALTDSFILGLSGDGWCWGRWCWCWRSCCGWSWRGDGCRYELRPNKGGEADWGVWGGVMGVVSEGGEYEWWGESWIFEELACGFGEGDRWDALGEGSASFNGLDASSWENRRGLPPLPLSGLWRIEWPVELKWIIYQKIAHRFYKKLVTSTWLF